jgi:hypothetical protein
VSYGADSLTGGDTFDYLWPTNAGRTLSSTFAESRDTHYHSGIDIRTNHSEGYRCYAVADGDVVRLKVGPYGYGKVLYLQLHDGRTAVYAHLQRFAPRVEAIVRASQYERRSFRTHLFFEPGELQFEKGEIVAYTGSTGIGHPHLHFEIRDREGYLNPMAFGFTVKDSRAPRPEKVTFFPLDYESEVDDLFEAKSLAVVPVRGQGPDTYELTAIPSVFGSIGLGISGDDHTDGTYNSVCFYAMELFLDDSLIFSARYDSFSYDETGLIHLERDFRLKRQQNVVTHHLWRDPECTADFYHAGEGIISTPDISPGLHDFEIVIADYMGNAARIGGLLHVPREPGYPQVRVIPPQSDFFDHHIAADSSLPDSGALSRLLKTDFYDDYVVFRVPREERFPAIELFLRSPYSTHIPMLPNDGQWVGKLPLRADLSNRWSFELQVRDRAGTVLADTNTLILQPIPTAGGIVISEDGRFVTELSSRAVYRTTYMRVYSEVPPGEEHFASDVYHLLPRDVPIRGEAGVSIRLSPQGLHPEQLGIYTLTRKGEWEFLDNDQRTNPGSVYGASRQLETYVLIRDPDPPELKWLAPQRSTKNARPTFRLRVEDEFSKVDDRTISLEIDGAWVLMEYDYENDLMQGRPEKPLSPGGHEVTVTVRDFCGNEAFLTRTLTILNR